MRLPLLSTASINLNYDFVLGILCAFIAYLLLTRITRLATRHILRRISSRNPITTHSIHDDNNNNGNNDRLYNLDHAILNLDIGEIPPRSMWMNLGYWKHTDNFPHACRALLEKVLECAGLLELLEDPASSDTLEHESDDGGGSSSKNRETERRTKGDKQILDVGFGCGDQTLYLTGLKTRIPNSTTSSSTSTDKGRPEGRRPLFSRYVGLTDSRQQAQYAEERLHLAAREAEAEAEAETETGTPIEEIHLFHEDAANPSSWKPEIHDLLLEFSKANKPTTPNEKGSDSELKAQPEAETYLLALDTLYHFTPSREPLFRYTHSTLHATIVAFDLFLSDTATLYQRVLLRLICLLSGSTPYSNFITMDQYRELLVKVGYHPKCIEIVDISEDVLPGISRYIKRRDEAMRTVGLGLGKFVLAGKLFGWWARTGVVRAGIVVARSSSSSSSS